MCLRHPEATRIGEALTGAGVVGDLRAPDRLRLGLAPITTSFTDVWEAADTIRRIAAGEDATRPRGMPGWTARAGSQDGEPDGDGDTGSDQELSCSFCGQTRWQVSKIVAGPDVYICDGCVGQAASVLGPGGPATTGTAAMARLDSHATGQRCSFCGQPFHRVAGLAAARDARICAECVELCEEIFAEEHA